MDNRGINIDFALAFLITSDSIAKPFNLKINQSIFTMNAAILTTLRHKVTASKLADSFNLRLASFIAFSLLSYDAKASVSIRNYSAIAQGIGFISLQSENQIAVNHHKLQWQTVVSNQFLIDEKDIGLSIDVEMYNNELFYLYRFNRLELGIQLNQVNYLGGFMDKPIEQFHKTFNLPNAGREFVEQDQYRINIVAEEPYLFNDKISGFGDTRLFSRYYFYENHSLITQIKLPTESELELGTGSYDFAAALKHYFPSNAASWHIQYGAVWQGERDWLDRNKQSLIFQAALAVDFHFTANHIISFQLDAHSELYAPKDRIFEESVFGHAFIGTASYQYNRHGYTFNFAILEDITVEASPDVSFLFSLSKSF